MQGMLRRHIRRLYWVHKGVHFGKRHVHVLRRQLLQLQEHHRPVQHQPRQHPQPVLNLRQWLLSLPIHRKMHQVLHRCQDLHAKCHTILLQRVLWVQWGLSQMPIKLPLLHEFNPVSDLCRVLLPQFDNRKLPKLPGWSLRCVWWVDELYQLWEWVLGGWLYGNLSRKLWNLLCRGLLCV